jgi:hypothetical protein
MAKKRSSSKTVSGPGTGTSGEVEAAVQAGRAGNAPVSAPPRPAPEMVGPSIGRGIDADRATDAEAHAAFVAAYQEHQR